MDKRKKLTIIAIALGVVILILLGILIYGLTARTSSSKPLNDTSSDTTTTTSSPANGDDKQIESTKKGNEKTDEASTEEDKVYTPTFMYFVSNNDATFEDETKLFNSLKKEYDGKVNFDMCNVDEDPDRAKNFQIGLSTPYLIMLDTSNNICALEDKCADKTKLTSDIEKALNGGKSNDYQKQ